MTTAGAPTSVLHLWCEHAWLGGPSATPGVVLHIEGERILSVVTGAAVPPPGAAVLEGLTLPGFANSHVRTTDRLLRGRPVQRSSEPNSVLSPPHLLHQLARAAYAELALNGYTTVCEFVVGASADHVAALVQAADGAGVRLAVADAWTAAEAPRDWVQRVEPFAEHVMRRSDVRFVAAAAHLTGEAVRSMGDLTIWAAQLGVPLHVAALELADAVTVLNALGDTGALGHRGGCTVIPPGFTGRDELAVVGHQRGFVAVDPEAPTAHRIPMAGLRGAGGRLVLANGLTHPADPFTALRSLGRIARQQQPPAHLATTELLRTATVDAMASLGWRDSGVLASGHLADLVTIALTSSRFAGMDPDDLLGSVLALATPADITHVARGGRLVVDRGRHLLGDVREMLDAALDACGPVARPAAVTR